MSQIITTESSFIVGGFLFQKQNKIICFQVSVHITVFFPQKHRKQIVLLSHEMRLTLKCFLCNEKNGTKMCYSFARDKHRLVHRNVIPMGIPWETSHGLAWDSTHLYFQ